MECTVQEVCQIHAFVAWVLKWYNCVPFPAEEGKEIRGTRGKGIMVDVENEYVVLHVLYVF